MFFAASVAVIFLVFFTIENYAHRALHEGKNIIASAPQASSVDFVFWLVQLLAPIVMALPLAMLMANFMSWLIPPIRNIENKIMADGVPDYTWHDLNLSLIKFSLVATPVCVILTMVSLIRV